MEYRFFMFHLKQIKNHENTIQNTGNPALDFYNIITYFCNTDSSYNFSCDISFHRKNRRTFPWYAPQDSELFDGYGINA